MSEYRYRLGPPTRPPERRRRRAPDGAALRLRARKLQSLLPRKFSGVDAGHGEGLGRDLRRGRRPRRAAVSSSRLKTNATRLTSRKRIAWKRARPSRASKVQWRLSTKLFDDRHQPRDDARRRGSRRRAGARSSAYTARLTTKPTPPTRPKRTSCSQLAGRRMPWSRRTCGRSSTAVASSRIRVRVATLARRTLVASLDRMSSLRASCPARLALPAGGRGAGRRAAGARRGAPAARRRRLAARARAAWPRSAAVGRGAPRHGDPAGSAGAGDQRGRPTPRKPQSYPAPASRPARAPRADAGEGRRSGRGRRGSALRRGSRDASSRRCRRSNAAPKNASSS